MPAMLYQPRVKARPRAQSGESGPPASVYLWSEVLEELQFNGAWRADRAAVGVLVGQAFQDPDDGQHYVEVEGFVANRHVPSSKVFFDHLRQGWREVSAEIERLSPHSYALGWYTALPELSRPGRREVILHHALFPLPWQFGLWLVPHHAPLALRPEGDRLQSLPVMILSAAEGARSSSAPPIDLKKAQESPETPQEPPETPQEPPESTQELPEIAQEPPETPQEPPETLQEPPETAQEPPEEAPEDRAG